MLDESTVELLRHLRHPNGWWRDTAQKLIILRNDRDSVVPLLKGMAQFSQDARARLHALWTLEGIEVPERDLVTGRYTDRDPLVRRAAIQISERWINDSDILRALEVFENERDTSVAQQLVLTLGMGRGQGDALIQKVAARHMKDRGMMLAAGVSLWGKKDLPFVKEAVATDPQWALTLANWNRGIDFPKDVDRDHHRLVRDGEVHYFNSCVSCHGADGKGTKTPGTDFDLAPSLVDSPRVKGPPEQLIPVLLHGLTGPLDGKSYQAGFMAPASALGLTREREIAQVLSYIRYAWGAEGTPVTEDEVKAVKAATKDRNTPWTQAELETR